MTDRYGPDTITGQNRAKRSVNEAKAKAFRDASLAQSPISQFQARMANPQAGDQGSWTSAGQKSESDADMFRRELIGGEGTEMGGSDTGTAQGPMQDTKFRNFVPGPNTLTNPKQGRVTIMGGDARTNQQTTDIMSAAQSDAGYRRPSTYTANGQTYVIPASGPRVSREKATSYAQMAAQEREATAARADKDRAFQSGENAKQAASDRVARLDEQNALDRSESRRAGLQDRQRQNDRSDYDFGRAKTQDAREDAGRLTPQQERANSMYQKILESPTASPRAKALATQAIAATAGVGAGIASELGRPSAQDNAAPVMDAINNDPLVAGRVQELKGAIARAQDLPWYKDLASAVTLGGYEGEASAPEVQAILDEVTQMAQGMADQYGLEIDAARQAILNQIMPGITGDTGVARQLRGGLRGNRATAFGAPAAPAAPANEAYADRNLPAF